MQVKAIGVFRMSGIGKDTGKPYDFSQLLYLRPIEPTATEKMQVRGFGYEVSKADLSNEALDKFSTVVFPADLELLTETVPARNGFRTVISGFKVVEGKVKAIA